MKSLNSSFPKTWLFIFLLPVCFLLPFIGQFNYQTGSTYSDLTISHLPNAIFLKNSLASGTGVPLWSPSILSGYPFAADPLSGLWYPVGWLAMLFPWAIGFNFLIILHMIFAGIGMFLWLRKEGLKPASAALGGLLFESMPKLFAHYEAGHITLAYSVCWTPWLLLAEKTWPVIKPWTGSTLRHIWRSPGVILGLIFLIDCRWAAFAGIIWLAYNLSNKMLKRKASIHTNDLINPVQQTSITGYLLNVLVQLILVGLIAAPLALPLYQYTRLSTRDLLTPAEALTLSMPPERLLGMVFPDIPGEAEWTFYPGCFSFIFLVLAIFSKNFNKPWLWIGLNVLSLIYAMGSAIPGLSLIARLPGFDLLRVPPRALFGTGLAFAVITAFVVDGLVRDIPFKFYNRFNPYLFLTGLAFFVLFMMGGLLILTRTILFSFIWGALFLALAAIWTGLRISGHIRASQWVVGVIVIGLVNTSIIEFLSLSPRSADAGLSENNNVTYLLSSDSKGLFRVYSPSYSLPQQSAAQEGLQLADGIDPLQLASYDHFMSLATGIPNQGYSVTVPPFPTGNTLTDNKAYQPDPFWLGLLNVKYVVSAFDLKTDNGLIFDSNHGDLCIYMNTQVRSRVWIDSGDNTPVTKTQPATITLFHPNEIDLEAIGPGRLVLSEIDYPGWLVKVDGKTAPINPAYNILRSVDLSDGQHTVQFIFQPVPVYLGLGLFCLPWLGLLSSRIFSLNK